MRLREPEELVEFEFEGRRLEAARGEPIAIGLLANRIYRTSVSASGRKRGAFYIGPAPVEVDGEKRVDSRARPIEPGIRVKRGKYLDFPTEPSVFGTRSRKFYEVIIIGGGPAGLGAAESLEGVSKAIIEAKGYLGGRAFLRQHEVASREPKADVFLNTAAIGVFRKGEYVLVPAVRGNEVVEFYAKRVILATGSVADTMVFENNDMPGIFRSDRALEAITLRGVKPGETVAVTGREPELVTGILESAGIDYVYVPRVFRAEGDESVERVYAGSYYEVDAVIVSNGRHPDTNPTTQAGAKLEFVDGYFAPRLDGRFRIDEFVYVAGSAYRIFADHRDSYYHGRAVGEFVLEDLGYGGDAEKRLERISGYAYYELDRIPLEEIDSERSFVCGCDVTLADVLEPLNAGFRDLQILKRLSHMGMGFCQGRYCLMHGVRLLHHEAGVDPKEIDFPVGRPPVRGVKMGVLARCL